MYTHNTVLTEAVDHLVKTGHTTAAAQKIVTDILSEVQLKDPASYSVEEQELIDVYKVLFSDAAPSDLLTLGKTYEVKQTMTTHSTVSPDATVNDLTGERTVSVQPTNAQAVATTRTNKEYVRPTLDSSDAKILSELVDGRRSQMIEATRGTKISKLLTMKPDPSSYMHDANGNPANVIPDVTPEKLAEYREALVSEDENVAAFSEVEAAVNNKTPMPVYVNDKANTRVVGIVVTTDGGTNSIVLTIPALQGFLISEVIGLIPGTPGVTISKWSQKEPEIGAGQGQISNTVAYPTLRWEGRKDAFLNGMNDSVCEPMTQTGALEYGIDSPFRGGKVRIDLSFRINTVTRAGKPSTRTIRVSGGLDEQPRWVVKPIYADYYNSPERKRVISIPTNDRELNAALEHVETGIAAIMSASYVPARDTLDSNPALSQMVQALRTASADSMSTTSELL